MLLLGWGLGQYLCSIYKCINTSISDNSLILILSLSWSAVGGGGGIFLAPLLCCITPVGGGDPFLLSQCKEGKVQSKLPRINPFCFWASIRVLLATAHPKSGSLGLPEPVSAGTHPGRVTNLSLNTHHSPTPLQKLLKRGKKELKQRRSCYEATRVHKAACLYK